MEVNEAEVAGWIAGFERIPNLFVVSIKVEDDLLFVEADCDEGISSDQCAALCNYIAEHCDTKGWDVAVTVSSPGLTSPLRHYRQFRKNIGRSVRVLTDTEAIEGRLEQVDADSFTISFEKKEHIEGKKRPVLVPYSRSFAFDEPKEVMLKLGKR